MLCQCDQKLGKKLLDLANKSVPFKPENYRILNVPGKCKTGEITERDPNRVPNPKQCCGTFPDQ
jgi:hypothetical protein